ncbi:META domain-containing protein [Cryobacterium sp. TMT2-23]|uniref:META domain-containing protein n=1 Tax=Cryobacterium sp. TMT2-23 TaxID=1259252 RepID=UPI001F53FAA0|nr:META domain-containing protein [Cryobacterium sp. TMT2-23]
MKKTIGLIAVAAAAALVLGLGGCASSAGTSTSDVTGVWGSPNTQGKPGLELKDDKSVAGSDDCNRLIGTWSLTGDTVEFGTFASTLMACEGVDTWLSQAKSATVAGSTMTVQGAQGTKIGTLQRASTGY